MKSIRPLYEQLGATNYYKKYAHQYQNPHQEQIWALLEQNQHRLDYSQIFDFCAGGGEVSQWMLQHGFANITASDPYTHALYERQIQQTCHRWSFQDIVQGKCEGSFSAIIASFALHLCPEEMLYALTIQLLQHAPVLVVITPHKRPQLEDYEGIILDMEDFALTDKGKKVFLKTYKLAY